MITTCYPPGNQELSSSKKCADGSSKCDITGAGAASSGSDKLCCIWVMGVLGHLMPLTGSSPFFKRVMALLDKTLQYFLHSILSSRHFRVLYAPHRLQKMSPRMAINSWVLRGTLFPIWTTNQLGTGTWCIESSYGIGQQGDASQAMTFEAVLLQLPQQSKHLRSFPENSRLWRVDWTWSSNVGLRGRGMEIFLSNLLFSSLEIKIRTNLFWILSHDMQHQWMHSCPLAPNVLLHQQVYQRNVWEESGCLAPYVVLWRQSCHGDQEPTIA